MTVKHLFGPHTMELVAMALLLAFLMRSHFSWFNFENVNPRRLGKFTETFLVALIVVGIISFPLPPLMHKLSFLLNIVFIGWAGYYFLAKEKQSNTENFEQTNDR